MTDAAYFDGIYARNPDPWDYARSDYEREKYAATLEALPMAHIERGLEVGCSIGVFTRLLAPRCIHLLAADFSEVALQEARRNRPRNVTFARLEIPAEWPEGEFDAIILSEVIYYVSDADRARMAAHCVTALAPEGAVAIVNYLGETGTPTSGHDAAEEFIRLVSPSLHRRNGHRTERYRLDVLAR